MKKYICIYFVFIFSLDFIEGAFRCDYEYSTAANAWFKYFVIPATWFDARLRCQMEGAILASPITPEIKTEMTRIVKKFNKSEIFTGISANVSKGDFFTVEGTPLYEFTLLAWAVNEPDNKDDAENCIVFNSNGDFMDKPCTLTRPYICYHQENSKMEFNECGTMDPEYRLDKRTQKCYKLHTEPRKFSRAFFTCAAEGGHLAVVNSDVEANVLVELSAKYFKNTLLHRPASYIVIGMHSVYDLMDWITIHGQTLQEAGYNNWENGEPNSLLSGERCGSINRYSNKLNDITCDIPYLFFCEKDPKTPKICKS